LKFEVVFRIYQNKKIKNLLKILFVGKKILLIFALSNSINESKTSLSNLGKCPWSAEKKFIEVL